MPAVTSRIAATSRGDSESLPIPASRLASAQRSGINPYARRRVQRPRRRPPATRPPGPALHSAAASTTSLLTRCRAETPARRELDAPLRVPHGGAAVTGRHGQLRADPRTPAPQAGRADRNRRSARPPAASSSRADAANLPTPSASAASPTSGVDAGLGGHRRPAPAHDRPSRAPAGASRVAGAASPGCCSASEASGPAADLRSSASSVWALP